MKKRSPDFIVILFLIIFVTPVYAQESEDISIKTEVNDFIQEWHKNAAEADLEYFNKISDDGIYIGTDPTELWTKSEFVEWSRKYFERGKAWSFETIERNIYLSSDTTFIWFDELLNTGMGVCRASGIVRKIENDWVIQHYHLSIAIPNENVNDIKNIIEKK